jgi:hypothetical protein
MTMKTLRLAVLALLCAAPTFAAARDYLTVQRTVEVARSADFAWKRLGDFCELGELLDTECKIESGNGGVGTVRRLNGVTVEALVARTPYSFTYSQVEGARANTDYHGTIAVEPIGKSRSRILYTLVIDRSRLPAGTDLADYQKQLEDRFQGAIVRAKSLLEKQR